MLIYLDHALADAKARSVSENRKFSRGDLHAAIMHGAVERVRPKMMTVVAITAGLLPILWSTGAGSEVMQRIAVPMIGGMMSSTVLTLVVIPAVYGLVKGWSLTREAGVESFREADATGAEKMDGCLSQCGFEAASSLVHIVRCQRSRKRDEDSKSSHSSMVHVNSFRLFRRPIGQQPECIGGDENGSSRVGENCHPERCNAEQRCGEEHRLQAERERDVLPDVAKRRLGERDEIGHAADPVAQKGGIGSLQRDIRAATHRNPDRRRGKSGRIIDSVADHGNRTMPLEPADLGELCVGQQFAEGFEA